MLAGTEVRRVDESPAETASLPLTDGRTGTSTSSDTFTSGATIIVPDASTRPAVGHPLLTCRFFTAEFVGTRPALTDSPAADPAEVLRAFDEELGRFEALPEDRTEEANASLEQLECLAQEVESFPTDGLSEEELRDRHVAVLRSWSAVRAASIRFSEGSGRPPAATLNDTQVTDRMRGSAARLVEVVTASSDCETVEDFETRLNAAIDEDDTEFLLTLSPETVTNFLSTHEMGRALFEFAEQDAGEDRLTGYLESARCFASLGLNDRVTEVLTAAQSAIDGLPREDEAAFLDGLLAVAGGYQEAGMTEEANRVFVRVSFVGENSADPESRHRGVLARAMRLLNQGDFVQAEEAVSSLPESETTEALLEVIHEGERRARVIQNLQLFQGYINLYAQTHSFAGGIDAEGVRTELGQALQSAADAALSGETPNLWAALSAEAPEFPSVASFLFDTPYGRNLEAISDPRLDREEYQFRILTMADGYMDDSDYTAAGIVAEVFRNDAELGHHSEEYFRRIEYHTSRETLSRSGANFVGDWLSMTGIGLLESAGHFLSTMTAGFSGTGGSIEDDLPGTAEFALLIASEGLSVEAESLFSTTRFARGLSPLARGAASWAVREGTMAGILTPGTLLIDAARRRSLDGLTVESFAREFGANVVMFSLCHFSGRATRGAAAPVRWGAGVGSFVASDYVNEGVGFRDARDAGIGERLLDATAADGRVRFASWLGNRISGGRFERLREEIALRSAEHESAWRAGRPSDRGGRRVDLSWARDLVRFLPIPGVGMGGIGFVSGAGGGRRGGGPLSGGVPGSYRDLSQHLHVFSATRGHDTLMADFASGDYARTPVVDAILGNPRLRPTTSVRAGDRTFYLGPVIRTEGPDGPRSYALGVVPILEGGGVRLREVIFYRSNSDGGWRVTPVRMGDHLVKGRLRIGDARGHYTQETQLAPELTRRLEALEGEPAVSLPEDALNMLINFESPLNGDRGVSLVGRFADQQRLSLAPGLEAAQRFVPGREMFWRDGDVPAGMDPTTWGIVSRVAPSISDLSTLPLPEGFVPDFAAVPIREYSGSHTLLGETVYREYPATLNGREVVWTMAEASGDRVWIQGIRYAEAQITDFGTYDVAIDSGILTSKPVEYGSTLGNLPAAYRRPVTAPDGSPTRYEDITPLLAELEPIRSYREARAAGGDTVVDAVAARRIVVVRDVAPEVVERPTVPPSEERSTRRPAARRESGDVDLEAALRALEARAAETDTAIAALRERVASLDAELNALDADATSRFLAEMDAWHAGSSEIDPRAEVYRDWVSQVRRDVAGLRERMERMEGELREAEARGDRVRVASLRGELLGDVSRRFEELSVDWRGNIDQARSRSRHRTMTDLFPLESAVVEAQRILRADRGVLWMIRPESLEAGVEISVPDTAAESLVIDRIAAQDGLTVDGAGDGAYRVTLADGRGFDLRISRGLDLPAERIADLTDWLDAQPAAISELGDALRSYDRDSLENLTDHLIARGWSQADIEGLFAQRGFTAGEAAAIVGPRISRAAREGRSGEGSL